METLKVHGDAPILITNAELLQILSIKCKKRQADQEATEAQQQEEEGGGGGENNATTAAGQPEKQPSSTNSNKNNSIRRRDKFQHRDYIEERVMGYLKSTPCSQDLDTLPTLVETLKSNVSDGGFGLTDGETLQILNSMPKESVEMHLIIEDVQSRLSEDRQNELLELISQYARTNINSNEDPDEELDEEEEMDNYDDTDQCADV